MEAVLMVLAGAIAVVIGVLWAFNAALLANPITWIVIAIMALVAVFVILWNECEGFRQFWINLWEKIKTAFNKFVETCRPLFDAIGNAFKELWELIKVIWDKVVENFKKAWEHIKKDWERAKPFFQNLWNGIKNIFAVVKEILGGYFKVAWEYIKGVWDVVVAYFTMIFNNIAKAFSAVRKILTGDFKGAWEDIKQIFSNVGTFFTSVWETIKLVFSNVGKTIAESIKNTVAAAINGILSSAVRIINDFIGAINFAIGIINAIPGVNISTLSYLSVPKLATGGITTGATLAMIGERGKEAVLPLENNTEWMDKLADRIAGRNNIPSKIVLKIGEKELRWATINSINDITK
jgi:phage-related protein